MDNFYQYFQRFTLASWCLIKRSTPLQLRISLDQPKTLLLAFQKMLNITGPILRIAVSTFCRCHADVQANPPNRHYDPGNVVFLLFFQGLFKMEG